MKLDDEPVLVEEVGLEVKRYLSPEIFFIWQIPIRRHTSPSNYSETKLRGLKCLKSNRIWVSIGIILKF